VIVAPEEDAGLAQVSFARTDFGAAADQASLTFTDLTGLAAVIGAALAAWAGAITEMATNAETSPARKRRDTFTCSAYSLNLRKY
jgi:hypothetical protein